MRRGLLFLIIAAVLVLGVRAALPHFLKYYVNRTLSSIPGYTGRVADIDVHLWRGAYQIRNAELLRTGGKIPVPFFSAERADLSVQWRAVLDGAFVGELQLFKPKLNFVAGPSKENSQTRVDRSWQAAVQDLFPLKFNHVRISGGEIHYRDFHTDPQVDIYLNRVMMTAENLANSLSIAESLVADIEGHGSAVDQAPVAIRLKLDPFAERPTFKLQGSVEHLGLVRLNDFFKAYARFDVERGDFSLFTELSANEGDFEGYVKPILVDVKVVRLESDFKNPLLLAWEGIVAFAAELLENQRHDQLASRIPVRGRFEDPKLDLWQALASLLSNAFVEALFPALENSLPMDEERGEEKG